jgi:hypothetical protein
MDINSFSLLPIDDKLSILNSNSERIGTINSVGGTTTLYSFHDFFIEMLKDDKDQIFKIEPIRKEDEAVRIRHYSMFIEYVDNSFRFRKRTETFFCGCPNCEYQFYVPANTPVMKLVCPVCDASGCEPIREVDCKTCKTPYYIGTWSKKGSCPNKCMK